MNEKLQLIEAQLYKSELTFPLLRERLLQHGEIRAWYRYYRGGNQWVKKYFTEENVFLMSSLLIWNQIAENGQMRIHSLKMDEIVKIERVYAFENKHSQKLILSEVTATLRTLDEKKKPDILVFKRPLLEEQGDIEGFEQLIALLD